MRGGHVLFPIIVLDSWVTLLITHID